MPSRRQFAPSSSHASCPWGSTFADSEACCCCVRWRGSNQLCRTAADGIRGGAYRRLEPRWARAMRDAGPAAPPPASKGGPTNKVCTVSAKAGNVIPSHGRIALALLWGNLSGVQLFLTSTRTLLPPQSSFRPLSSSLSQPPPRVSLSPSHTPSRRHQCCSSRTLLPPSRPISAFTCFPSSCATRRIPSLAISSNNLQNETPLPRTNHIHTSRHPTTPL